MPSGSSRSSSTVAIRRTAADSPDPKLTVLGGVSARNDPVAFTRTVTLSALLRLPDRVRSNCTSSPSSTEAEAAEMLTNGRSLSTIMPVASDLSKLPPRGLDSFTVKVSSGSTTVSSSTGTFAS